MFQLTITTFEEVISFPQKLREVRLGILHKNNDPTYAFVTVQLMVTLQMSHFGTLPSISTNEIDLPPNHPQLWV